MPYAIIILSFIVGLGFIRYIVLEIRKAGSRKESWLTSIIIGDKAIVKIPEDKIIFGKVSKLRDAQGNYTIEYKVPKEYIYPPFK